MVAGRVRVARYQIETLLRRRLSSFECLCKMEQCVQVLSAVFFCIESPQINDALRWRAFTNERLPVLERSWAQRKRIVAIVLELSPSPNDLTSAPVFAQSRNQSIADAGCVRENEP